MMPNTISAVLSFIASATGGFACDMETTSFQMAYVVISAYYQRKGKVSYLYVEIFNKLMQSAFAITKDRSAYCAVRSFLLQIADVAEIIKIFADTDAGNADLSG